ncbi:hypothetical protein LOD99_2841 [Oopsacas minuta]|uniref:Uncharacterized protein n=1 Tax=Oopsacas minuta TaxID=111878 RepID=A0AAV7K173_9METZ|nr:hypothetical protein LOD99_2841 [Oopsacas minuta]
MALGAMDTYDTPFYMFANADNLYDNSLISTTTTIFDAIKSGEMSTKVLIIGHRFNVKTNDRIGTEIEIKKLKQISETNKPFAKDYAIFTRDTYDWAGFPDMLVARRFFDSFMVDFAFHNEIQMVDATATIPLVHQVKQLGYSTSLYADQGETDWNEKIFGVKTSHSSILCSEFQTIHSDKEIMIYDKVKHTFLSTNLVTKFSEGYNTAIRNIQNTRKGEYFDNSDLTFVVVTLNKPHSLERLITQLNNVAYNCHLNLAIIVNRGKTQLFDLQTLNVVSNSKWVHGDKLIHLSHKHLTQLEQWLEVDKLGITQFILFQDDVTLSTYFYIALTKAMDSIKESISWLEGNIGGVSLEPPLTFPPNSKAYLKLSAQYQDNLVMSQPINSRALFPNPLVWRLFSDWARETINSNKFNIKDLGNTFAARNINYGDKTDWYKTIAGVWFCYYLELTHRTLGYLKHPKGVIATWGYRGLEGTNNFLGYNCSLKNVIIKTQIPILTDENPKFRFSGNPPVIKIEEIDKLY